MEVIMDEIIKQLSAIENSASDIMEAANAQKKALAQEMQEKTKAWDLELDSKTQAEILRLKTEISSQIEEKLKSQKEKAASDIAALENEYEKNHDLYVNRILASLIKE